MRRRLANDNTAISWILVTAVVIVILIVATIGITIAGNADWDDFNPATKKKYADVSVTIDSTYSWGVRDGVKIGDLSVSTVSKRLSMDTKWILSEKGELKIELIKNNTVIAEENINFDLGPNQESITKNTEMGPMSADTQEYIVEATLYQDGNVVDSQRQVMLMQ